MNLEIEPYKRDLEDAKIHEIGRINALKDSRINSSSLSAPEFICEMCGVEGCCECPTCYDCHQWIDECRCSCIVCGEYKRVCPDYEFVEETGKWYSFQNTCQETR